MDDPGLIFFEEVSKTLLSILYCADSIRIDQVRHQYDLDHRPRTCQVLTSDYVYVYAENTIHVRYTLTRRVYIQTRTSSQFENSRLLYTACLPSSLAGKSLVYELYVLEITDFVPLGPLASRYHIFSPATRSRCSSSHTTIVGTTTWRVGQTLADFATCV